MQYFKKYIYKIKWNIIHNPKFIVSNQKKESINVQSSFDLHMIPEPNLFCQKYSFSLWCLQMDVG